MATDINTILKLHVPVIVSIGRNRTPLSEIMSLGPGSILEMNRNAEAEIDMLINNKLVGQGLAVKVGENFGIKITTIDSPQDRIEAMG